MNVKGYNFFYPAEFAIFKCSKLDQLAPPPYELLGSFCSQATLSPITPPTSSTPQWTIFIKEKLILISFFIHILQLLSYNGKNNVHNVDNFFNFVSFTYTQKNLTIFSLVILRNWSSEFSCLKKIRIMFHCAVSSRKHIEIFKICPNILGKSGWRKIKIRVPHHKAVPQDHWPDSLPKISTPLRRTPPPSKQRPSP